jgi:hypothetical protein
MRWVEAFRILETHHYPGRISIELRMPISMKLWRLNNWDFAKQPAFWLAVKMFSVWWAI